MSTAFANNGTVCRIDLVEICRVIIVYLKHFEGASSSDSDVDHMSSLDYIFSVRWEPYITIPASSLNTRLFFLEVSCSVWRAIRQIFIHSAGHICLEKFFEIQCNGQLTLPPRMFYWWSVYKAVRFTLWFCWLLEYIGMQTAAFVTGLGRRLGRPAGEAGLHFDKYVAVGR
jgi:hypothetical protein